MRNITKLISRIILDASRKACNKAVVMCFALLCLVATGCVREPKLHLHQGGADIAGAADQGKFHGVHSVGDYVGQIIASG